MSFEDKIANVNEEIVKLIGEEESLRDLKNATAADFRDRINEIKAKRKKKTQEAKELEQASVESTGTMLFNNGSGKAVDATAK